MSPVSNNPLSKTGDLRGHVSKKTAPGSEGNAIFEAALQWRKSSFSGANGDCVEVADTGGLIAFRHSKEPQQGTILYTRSELSAFIRGCKAGEFDDLALS